MTILPDERMNMFLKPEQRDAPNTTGARPAVGVAEINFNYRHDLFRNWLDNYSGSSMKGLRRLIKKKVTVPDWERYVDRRCLSYHIRGFCNTGCRKSDDHQVLCDEEARLLLNFCQSVEQKPAKDAVGRKAALPGSGRKPNALKKREKDRRKASPTSESVSSLNTNALHYHYARPKTPGKDTPIRTEASPTSESVSSLNTNALHYHYTRPKTPETDTPIRTEASPTSESVSSLNTNALDFHYTRPKTPEKDAPIRDEASPTSESVSSLNTNALDYHYTGPLSLMVPSSSDAVVANDVQPIQVDSVIANVCPMIFSSVPTLSRTEHYKQINQYSHQPWSKNSDLLTW